MIPLHVDFSCDILFLVIQSSVMGPIQDESRYGSGVMERFIVYDVVVFVIRSLLPEISRLLRLIELEIMWFRICKKVYFEMCFRWIV